MNVGSYAFRWAADPQPVTDIAVSESNALADRATTSAPFGATPSGGEEQ